MQTNAGGWLIGVAHGSLGRVEPKLERVRWWLDFQARFRDDADGFLLSLLEPGVGYDVAPGTRAWMGYGWVHVAAPGADSDTDQHWIWQQVTWGRRLGPIVLGLRPRFEERFSDRGDDVAGRFRQFVRITWPLPSTSRFYLTLFDEVLVNLNDADWGPRAGFDENRMFAGVGWRFDVGAKVSLELGYMNQYVQGSSSTQTMNHLAVMNFILID